MDIIDVFADEALSQRFSESGDENPSANPINVVLNGSVGDVIEMPIWIKNTSTDYKLLNGQIDMQNTGAVTVEVAPDNNGTAGTYASLPYSIGDLDALGVIKLWLKFTVPENTTQATINTTLDITGLVV
jgi:hypothetical protein